MLFGFLLTTKLADLVRGICRISHLSAILHLFSKILDHELTSPGDVFQLLIGKSRIRCSPLFRDVFRNLLIIIEVRVEHNVTVIDQSAEDVLFRKTLFVESISIDSILFEELSNRRIHQYRQLHRYWCIVELFF